MAGFIAVHVGAGYHKVENRGKYKKLCREACIAGARILNAGGTAFLACQTAVMVLEESKLTNAGYGSSLSMTGKVSCDASIMDGENLNFGACGAVKGVKYPISLASQICIDQLFPRPLAMIPPNIIVGPGAAAYARKSNLTMMSSKDMITKRARIRYKRTKLKFNEIEHKLRTSSGVVNVTEKDDDNSNSDISDDNITAETHLGKLDTNKNTNETSMRNSNRGLKRKAPCISIKIDSSTNTSCSNQDSSTNTTNTLKDTSTNTNDTTTDINTNANNISSDINTNANNPPSSDNPSLFYKQFDTVGAVCVDSRGQVASACSSGGLALKYDGRVGQAASYASGVWADSTEKDKPAIAVTTTGAGEHLIKTLLAKELADQIKDSSCPTHSFVKCMKQDFLDSRYLEKVNHKIGGALVLHIYPSGQGELLWGHTSRTMGMGYMDISKRVTESTFSELPLPKVGHSVLVSGAKFNLRQH